MNNKLIRHTNLNRILDIINTMNKKIIDKIQIEETEKEIILTLGTIEYHIAPSVTAHDIYSNTNTKETLQNYYKKICDALFDNLIERKNYAKNDTTS